MPCRLIQAQAQELHQQVVRPGLQLQDSQARLIQTVPVVPGAPIPGRQIVHRPAPVPPVVLIPGQPVVLQPGQVVPVVPTPVPVAQEVLIPALQGVVAQHAHLIPGQVQVVGIQPVGAPALVHPLEGVRVIPVPVPAEAVLRIIPVEVAAQAAIPHPDLHPQAGVVILPHQDLLLQGVHRAVAAEALVVVHPEEDVDFSVYSI